MQRRTALTTGTVSENHVYVTPSKMVKTIGDMQMWEKSEAYYEYLGFIGTMNDLIKGKSNTEGSNGASQEIDKICDLLDSLDKWIDQIPPIKQPQRFGNQSFRQWYGRLKDEATTLLHTVLPESLYRAVPEIMIYLIEGFGNSIRIDYGTGHELSYLMFLCALFKIGYLKPSDGPATACKVFVRYLEVVRKLQLTYNMEPAGSHGVWSLDDYQFVPFIWGSSQFAGNGQFEPTCFLKDNIIRKNASQYMFLSCIQYINMVKTGPFAEHSNQLWSISGVSTWSKINSGLIKMYRAEVLAKFPLVQHIYFGSIFTLNPFEPPKIERPKTSFQALNNTPSNTASSDTPGAKTAAVDSVDTGSYGSVDGAGRNTGKFESKTSVGSKDTGISSKDVSNAGRESADAGKFAFKVASDCARDSTDLGRLSRDAVNTDHKGTVEFADNKDPQTAERTNSEVVSSTAPVQLDKSTTPAVKNPTSTPEKKLDQV